MEIKAIGKTFYAIVSKEKIHVRLNRKRPNTKSGLLRFFCDCHKVSGTELYLLVSENDGRYELGKPIDRLNLHSCGIQLYKNQLLWNTVKDVVSNQFLQHKTNKNGSVFQGIEALRTKDPDLYGIATTTGGKLFASGDSRVRFTIQSCSKPFLFLFCLNRYGEEDVMSKIGSKQQNRPFNATSIEDGKTLNCNCNSGALTLASMVLLEFGDVQRSLNVITREFKKFFNMRSKDLLEPDAQTVEDEMNGWRGNASLVLALQNQGIIDCNLCEKSIVELHTTVCGLLINSEELCYAGRMLLMGGVHENKRIVSEKFTGMVMRQLFLSGAYEDSIEVATQTGGLLKSGISGCMLCIFPNKLVVAGLSPALNANGNSVRMIEIFKGMSVDLPILQLFI